MHGMGALEILAAGLGIVLVGVAATLWWCQRVWRRRDELPPWTKIVVGVLVSSAVLGGLGTIIGLVKMSGAVGGESVDPSQKARILAEGISEAMNCTALSVLVWIPSAVTLAIVTRPRGSKPVVPN
jgi:hypothetical protein